MSIGKEVRLAEWAPEVWRGILDFCQFDALCITVLNQLTPGAIFEIAKNPRPSNLILPMPEMPTRLDAARYDSNTWVSLALSNL
ncbi:hypothetical protein MFRU_006g00430 [Monilinia fructicola]|uniref:Uncharacterized protein n=1 Tax=Monilinia fructicola TaxID=38448 RepID=A0A5M9JA64_MONFR|nr:hypothetical protein EYC84_009320 [Monilinia fructicola]KAG4032572.1 hypothetical protein MFRU_006g00430 [Monilinia fructicola]